MEVKSLINRKMKTTITKRSKVYSKSIHKITNNMEVKILYHRRQAMARLGILKMKWHKQLKILIKSTKSWKHFTMLRNQTLHFQRNKS
jgi:hypothetical protein